MALVSFLCLFCVAVVCFLIMFADKGVLYFFYLYFIKLATIYIIKGVLLKEIKMRKSWYFGNIK